jgi:hypothetical protein
MDLLTVNCCLQWSNQCKNRVEALTGLLQAPDSLARQVLLSSLSSYQGCRRLGSPAAMQRMMKGIEKNRPCTQRVQPIASQTTQPMQQMHAMVGTTQCKQQARTTAACIAAALHAAATSKGSIPAQCYSLQSAADCGDIDQPLLVQSSQCRLHLTVHACRCTRESHNQIEGTVHSLHC